MKRLLHIMFACACALFAFVSNAEAQSDGDIVTITCKSGNSTYYLAVNDDGKDIVNGVKEKSENCYWRVTVKTVSGTTIYTFQSIISGRYLTINNGSLSLNTTSQDITKNSKKYYARVGNGTYYIRYRNNSWTGSTSGSDLTITKITGFTRDFLTVAPTPYDGTELTELEELTTITLTAKTGVEIKSFTKNLFSLTGPTGASISNVTASGNVLTITVANGDNEGTYTLNIPNGAVEDQYGISFEAATYSWKVSNPYHKFTSVTPAEGTTNGFNTIRLTANADIEEELRFGYYQQENNDKVLFEFSYGTIKETSKPTQGLSIKRFDDARTLEITIPDNLGEGDYKLTIEQGAIQSSDGRNFPTATYTWTVSAHQFGAVQPDRLEVGDRLEQIIIPAADPTVTMNIPHDPDQIVDWITLKNAGGAVIPTTVAIVNNELVITPIAALGNGTYTLEVKKGAVVGPHSVPFEGKTQTWNVVVTVSVTHVKGFYPALGEGGYQNVHTVERTIYYTGNETSIPLTLAETNFFGYMRWYNYATDGGEDINWTTPPRARNNADFEPITGSAKHLGWFAWAKSTGNDGVLDRQSDQVSGNNTPAIDLSGWTGNHTIACDVSNYLDL